MTLHTAVPMSYAHERYLGRPSCPKCGELIMAPDFSEYLKNEASIVIYGHVMDASTSSRH